jgi:hypothetical protein
LRKEDLYIELLKKEKYLTMTYEKRKNTGLFLVSITLAGFLAKVPFRFIIPLNRTSSFLGI